MIDRYYIIEVKNYYKHITSNHNGLYDVLDIYEVLDELNYTPESDEETIKLLKLLIETGSAVVGDYELTIDWDDIYTIQRLKRELEDLIPW